LITDDLRETVKPPWAQGVGRSNRPAPTNILNQLQRLTRAGGLYALNGGTLGLRLILKNTLP
jgi:hypothetical protein